MNIARWINDNVQGGGKVLQVLEVRNRKVLMKDVGLSWKSKDEFDNQRKRGEPQAKGGHERKLRGLVRPAPD